LRVVVLEALLGQVAVEVAQVVIALPQEQVVVGHLLSLL
jgi:hypothetical protein